MYIKLNKNFMSTDMQCGGDICCSNHGTCDVSTGACVCDSEFEGADCSIDILGKKN